jgi:hypothetical protein
MRSTAKADPVKPTKKAHKAVASPAAAGTQIALNAFGALPQASCSSQASISSEFVTLRFGQVKDVVEHMKRVQMAIMNAKSILMGGGAAFMEEAENMGQCCRDLNKVLGVEKIPDATDL